MTRNEAAELLEAYTLFLQKEGYLDTDATCEEPTAIGQFMGRINFKCTIVKTIEERAYDFMQRVAEFKSEYSKEMLRAFYDYWTEKNEGGRKMRFEMQKVFDIKRRLVTWSNNEKKKFNGKSTIKTGNHLTAEGTLHRLNSYTND